jgi:hypothetical protein
MQSYQTFLQKKKQTKLSSLLKKAEQFGFDDMDNDTDAFKALTIIHKKCFDKRERKKIDFMSIDIDFREIIPAINDAEACENYFQRMDCDFNEEDGVYEQNFVEKIEDLLDEKKAVYLFINYDGYGVDEEEEEKYSCHGVTGLFVPVRRNKYKFFLVNSHGSSNYTEREFEKRLSSTRIKKTKFKESIDIVVMKKLIENLNNNVEQEIEYTGTKRDTYFGANLQSGDDHGICFVVPLILYYNFGKYYYQPFDKENNLFDSVSNLLKGNRLNDFVHYCLIDYLPQLRVELTMVTGRDAITHVETVLKKSGFRFVKHALYTMISFMTQSYVKKQIKKNM